MPPPAQDHPPPRLQSQDRGLEVTILVEGISLYLSDPLQFTEQFPGLVALNEGLEGNSSRLCLVWTGSQLAFTFQAVQVLLEVSMLATFTLFCPNELNLSLLTHSNEPCPSVRQLHCRKEFG